MWSKQKIRRLFTDNTAKEATRFGKRISKNTRRPVRVDIYSIREEGHKKYFRIVPRDRSSFLKNEVKFNLNNMRRLNLREGSTEMYRHVNGLCQYCGNDRFTGIAKGTSEFSYTLTDIICNQCGRTQPHGYYQKEKVGNKPLINRGKRYAESKHKKNLRKYNNKKREQR